MSAMSDKYWLEVVLTRS
jgi:leucyl aminopeptidase